MNGPTLSPALRKYADPNAAVQQETNTLTDIKEDIVAEVPRLRRYALSLLRDSVAAAANAGNKKAGMKGIGKTCGGCHKPFRGKKVKMKMKK
jgi:cytochrome c556